jgi:hypothetical protein
MRKSPPTTLPRLHVHRWQPELRWPYRFRGRHRRRRPPMVSSTLPSLSSSIDSPISLPSTLWSRRTHRRSPELAGASLLTLKPPPLFPPSWWAPPTLSFSSVFYSCLTHLPPWCSRATPSPTSTTGVSPLKLSPPLHWCCVIRVNSTLLYLARRLPHTALKSPVKTAQSSGHRQADGERATAPPRAPWANLAAGLGRALEALGQFRPVIVSLLLNFFSKLKSSRNSYNLIKFIVNGIKLRKNMK